MGLIQPTALRPYPKFRPPKRPVLHETEGNIKMKTSYQTEVTKMGKHAV